MKDITFKKTDNKFNLNDAPANKLVQDLMQGYAQEMHKIEDQLAALNDEQELMQEAKQKDRLYVIIKSQPNHSFFFRNFFKFHTALLTSVIFCCLFFLFVLFFFFAASGIILFKRKFWKKLKFG